MASGGMFLSLCRGTRGNGQDHPRARASILEGSSHFKVEGCSNVSGPPESTLDYCLSWIPHIHTTIVQIAAHSPRSKRPHRTLERRQAPLRETPISCRFGASVVRSSPISLQALAESRQWRAGGQGVKLRWHRRRYSGQRWLWDVSLVAANATRRNGRSHAKVTTVVEGQGAWETLSSMEMCTAKSPMGHALAMRNRCWYLSGLPGVRPTDIARLM